MDPKNNEAEEVPADEHMKQELADAKKRNDELLTRLKYAQADLENYRKRMDKEMKEAGESVARGLLSRLLVVQDELDMAAKHSEEERHGGDTVREGLAMVSKNLKTAMESVGLQRIDAVGKPFDPSLHEAVERIQGGSHTEDTVVEEVRPGFTFRGQLLRPSMVKVELGSKAAEEEKRVE